MFDDPSALVTERLRKINQLRALGIDPYPAAAFSPTIGVPAIRRDAQDLAARSARVRIAGRITARRRMGKVLFVDLLDDGARIQVFVRRPLVGEQRWSAIELIDLGDFLGVDGKVFFTEMGELSVLAEELTVLGKASHPLPTPKQQGDRVFDAITDKGLRYRQRHLDLVCNETSRQIFLKRSRIIRGIRRYLDDAGFVEVETPTLGIAYGGAAARPFTTRVNALDQEMYLRISPECALKRVLCGGINKVYELGKNFRNEGVDASHNPEFTMVEWYEAYSDYLAQMERFETLVAGLCEEINGTTRIRYRGRALDLTPPWRRLPMLDAVREACGVDVGACGRDEMAEVFRRCHPQGVAGLPAPLTWGGAVVTLYEALVEPALWEPTFVMDHPMEISPLTKQHRRDPRLVERFEPMIAGMEVGNSYSELNDPVEQYERLASQQVSRDDAYDLDLDFLQAIAHGMPPAGGTGLGVDRIVMLLTGAESIRDVVFFPLVTRAAGEAAPAAAESAPTETAPAEPVARAS